MHDRITLAILLLLGLMHAMPMAFADTPVQSELEQAQKRRQRELEREQQHYREEVGDLPVIEQMRIDRQLNQQRLEQGMLHQRQRAEAALLEQRMRQAPDRASGLGQAGRARFQHQLQEQRLRFQLERRVWPPPPRLGDR